MKVYKYDSKRYFFAVIAPTFFMLIILIYAVIANIKDLTLNIYSLCIIVTIYGIFNNIISLCNPSKIIDNGKHISIYSFGRCHKYLWEEIKYIRIKEFHNKKIYLRIGNSGLMRGRYWIKIEMYNDGEELYLKLIELEKELHPNLLKFRTKRETIS